MHCKHYLPCLTIRYGKKNNFSAYDGIEMRNLGHNERANLFIKLVSNKYYQDSKKPPLRAHQFSLNSNRKVSFDCDVLTVDY